MRRPEIAWFQDGVVFTGKVNLLAPRMVINHSYCFVLGVISSARVPRVVHLSTALNINISALNIHISALNIHLIN